MTININKKSLNRLMIITLAFVIVIAWCLLTIDQVYLLTGVLCITLLYLICGAILIDGDEYIFNPLLMFSIMYSTTSFTVLYSIMTKFRTAYYLLYSASEKTFISLLNETLLLFIIGYIFFCGGYLVVKNRNITIRNNKGNAPFTYKNGVVLGAIYLCFFIAVANFLYVLYNTSGNILFYMMNVSVLKYIYGEEQISTIGYNFGYVAVYLYTIVCQKKDKYSIGFWLVFAITVLIKASSGRIFQTIAYAGVVFGLMYVHSYKKNIKGKERLNRTYIRIGASLGIIAIAFYFLRAIGNIQYSNKGANTNDLFNEMINNLFYYLFDKGNTVNTILVPKIIDDWSADIGLLFGRSILSSSSQIIHSLNTLFPSIGLLIKDKWFVNIISGAIPPTCIGELIANFGIIGVPIGMLIFGWICGLIYNKHLRSISTLGNLIYFQILVDFIFIYPKTDFSNFPLFSILFTAIIYKVVIYLSVSKR